MKRPTLETVRRAYNATVEAWTEINWNQPFPANYYGAEDENDYSTIIWAKPWMATLTDEEVKAEARAHCGKDVEPRPGVLEVVFEAFKQAADYAHKVRLDARDAAEKAKEAMEWLERGNPERGLHYAKDAASIERKYGDAPVYGPFVRAVEEYVEAERNKPSLTPEKAVKEWAKDHPGFTGLVVVYKNVRNGLLGRRGTRSRKFEVWVKEGKAASSRDNRKAGTCNGLCSVCGQVYLDRVLVWGAAPDPNAGREVAVPGYIEWKGWTYINARWAYMLACPDCFGAADLVRLDSERVRADDAQDYERKIYPWRRYHPSAKHLEPERDRKLRMDL